MVAEEATDIVVPIDMTMEATTATTTTIDEEVEEIGTRDLLASGMIPFLPEAVEMSPCCEAEGMITSLEEETSQRGAGLNIAAAAELVVEMTTEVAEMTLEVVETTGIDEMTVHH